LRVAANKKITPAKSGFIGHRLAVGGCLRQK
jgi:hypothetical protein